MAKRTEATGNDPSTVDAVDGGEVTCCLADSSKVAGPLDALPILNRPHHSKLSERTENIYESAPVAAKCDKNDKNEAPFNNNSACCRNCTPAHCRIDNVTVSRPCLRRLIRKSRSRKQKSAAAAEHCSATRIRSLSVGNENAYRNQRVAHLNGEADFAGDMSSGASGKDRNEECLNNLKRNDLIDIIRESMEKSRLCFQSNG